MTILYRGPARRITHTPEEQAIIERELLRARRRNRMPKPKDRTATCPACQKPAPVRYGFTRCACGAVMKERE